MADSQNEIILNLLHHMSDKVDSMQEIINNMQIQTALNTDAITRHTQQTSSIQLSMTNCQEECEKRLEEAISINKYIKWSIGSMLTICTIIAAILEIYKKFK